jgi:hypothetical protein
MISVEEKGIAKKKKKKKQHYNSTSVESLELTGKT